MAKYKTRESLEVARLLGESKNSWDMCYNCKFSDLGHGRCSEVDESEQTGRTYQFSTTHEICNLWEADDDR